MLSLHILVITAQCIRVHTLDAIEQSLQHVQIGVHTPNFNPTLKSDQQFRINYMEAFKDIPTVWVWFTEVSEQGSGTNKVRISTDIVKTEIKLSNFSYKVNLQSTTFTKFSVQWIASTLKGTELGIKNFQLDSLSKIIQWDNLYSQTPNVLFFFRELETYGKRITQITKNSAVITKSQMNIDPSIVSPPQKAFVIVLVFSTTLLKTIKGYLTTDIYTQNDWITTATSIPKTFNYPVLNQDNILRGFYAFNNNQSDFNAKISAQFASGQSSGQLECTIPIAQTKPIEGFKFMAGQFAFVVCPSNSTFVPPNCLCSDGYYDDVTECQKCPLTCKRCTSKIICQQCINGTSNLVLMPEGLCECSFGYFYDSTQCSKCSLRCLTCSSAQICYSCSLGRILVLQSCVCKVGYFEDYDLVCQQCPLSCTSCENESKCTSCSQELNRLLINETCHCQLGYFDLDLSCQKCSTGCSKCNSLESCQECLLDKNRELIQQLCKCINGYFEDMQLICFQCSPRCPDCFDDLSCRSCDVNLNFVLEDTRCVCKQGFYEQDTICTQCQPLCSTCLGQTMCVTCKELTNLVRGNCVCDLGFFLDIEICKSCLSKCHDCQDDMTCNSCKLNSNREIINNCECNQGFYENDNKQCVESKVQSDLPNKDQSDNTNSSTILEDQTNIPTYQSHSSQTQYSQIEKEKTQINYVSFDDLISNDKEFVDKTGVVTTDCGQGCIECERSNKCTSCDTTKHFRLSQLGVCICDETFVEIQGICQACEYPCLLCSNSPYNCTSCDTYHTLNSSNQCTCKPPFKEDINLRLCQQEDTIDANIIGAFEGINKQLKGNTSVAMTVNLAIPIGLFGLITNSPQFLLLDLFIKPVHPLKVYKSLETLSRFVIPIYLPEVQGSSSNTSLMLFGAYNATQYAYQYGQPLNETYMYTLGFSPYSIITCSQHLIVLLFTGLIWIVSSILVRFKLLKKIVARLKDLNYGLLHLTMESGILFLAVSWIYTLVTISEYETFEVLPLFIVSVFTSLLILGSQIGYLLYVIYQIIIAHKRNEQQILQKRFPFFFYQVRTHKVASSLFKVTSQLKKVIYAFIVICFKTLPGYALLIILQTLFTIYILLVIPQQYISIFILDVCLQTLYIAFLAFSLSDHQEIDEGPAGDGTFCVILCVLLFNLMGNVGKTIAGYEVGKVQKQMRDACLEGSPEEISGIVLQQ